MRAAAGRTRPPTHPTTPRARVPERAARPTGEAHPTIQRNVDKQVDEIPSRAPSVENPQAYSPKPLGQSRCPDRRSRRSRPRPEAVQGPAPPPPRSQDAPPPGRGCCRLPSSNMNPPPAGQATQDPASESRSAYRMTPLPRIMPGHTRVAVGAKRLRPIMAELGKILAPQRP